MNLEALTDLELELINEYLDLILVKNITNQVSQLDIESKQLNNQKASSDFLTQNNLFEQCKINHSKTISLNHQLDQLGVCNQSVDSQYLCRLKQQHLIKSLRKQYQEDTFKKQRQLYKPDQFQ